MAINKYDWVWLSIICSVVSSPIEVVSVVCSTVLQIILCQLVSFKDLFTQC